MVATAKFADRKPSLGRAWKLADDRLALASPGSSRLGVDEAAMSATFVISTIDRDRVGDEVVPEGCVLTRYALNPIVFFGHQQIPFPVGRAMDPAGKLTVKIEPGKRIVATTYFSQRTADALQVFALIAEGMLPGTSIGFNPLDDPEKLGEAPGAPFGGYRFNRWELLEYSHVGVPCNPYAVQIRSHLSRGRIAGSAISPALRKSLEPLAAITKVWAPGYSPSKGTAMNESDATAGGDAVPNTEAIKSAVVAVAEKHKGADPDYHVFHVHPEKCEVHHSFGDGADGDHVQRVGDDLKAIPGVKAVHQEAESGPKGDGWEKVFPVRQEGEQDEPKPTGDDTVNGKHGKHGKRKDVGAADGDPNAQTMPPGAALAHKCHKAIKEAEPTLEPDHREKFWSKCAGMLAEHVGKNYPEHKIDGAGEEDDAGDDATVADDADDKEAEEIVDQYRANKPLAAKLLRQRLKARIVKRLAKRVKAVITEAADHLEEMAALDPKAFGKVHKTASMSHCKAIRRCMKDDMGDDDGGEEDESMKGVDTAALAVALKGLDDQLTNLGKQVYRVTGKK